MTINASAKTVMLSKDELNLITKPKGEALAIEVNNITVAYRSYKERPTSLKESVIRFLRNGQIKSYSTFNALSDVSLKVAKGSVIGIIGGNGSGKSTLLKVIAKVLTPINGTVKIEGRIASLIELGAGFDPELNAIENIYLNASLHKKTKREIEPRIDKILEFADLKEFAHTPVKYFSSGMYARLGFSVAIDIDPDILLVDEILSVGDERFKQKCDEVFKKFLDSGKTIIIVSHDTDGLCSMVNKMALFSRGELVYFGDPVEAVKRYRNEDYRSSLGS
jgi:ABC-type polysaccharide/polyol phosphate transport system ATPase subunit